MNLEAISKLSVSEKTEIIEAIRDTIEETEADEVVYYKDDEDDVRLAQEALDEYLADPSIGISFDDFIAEELKRLNQTNYENNPSPGSKRYKNSKQLV